MPLFVDSATGATIVNAVESGYQTVMMKNDRVELLGEEYIIISILKDVFGNVLKVRCKKLESPLQRPH